MVGGRLQLFRLGATGIEVTRLCFGALTIGPLQANLEVVEGAGVIAYALEKGINFIDTAESYATYPYIREALRMTGIKPVIATKSYAYTRQGMKDSLERALDEMGLENIDIFLLHEQENELTLQGHREALQYLLEAREVGLVKAVGISTHAIAGVMAGADHPGIQIIHPLINRAGIGILDGSAESMAAAICYAACRGKGIYAMKTLGGGHLIRQARQAMSYVLNIPGVSSMAVGMKNKAEVDLNLLWLEGLTDPELERRVGKEPRRLLIEPWCSGCGSCVEACRYGALTVSDKAYVDMDKCVLCGYCAAHCRDFCLKVV